jgi:hypothetical protein
MNWIGKNYDLTTIEIIDYLMPASKIIKRRDGSEILIYWDFIKKKVIESDF